MSRSRKKNAYRGSRRFDATCRCHGSCDWCRGNRLYQSTKALIGTKTQLKELT